MSMVRFLTHPDLIRWVRVTSTSVVDLCLSPPNWHRWLKLLNIDKNCNLSPIILLKSFLIMLSNMIGWNNLDELYEALLCLGIMTMVDILKWDGQWPKSIYVLVISISFIIHSLFLTIFLICLQDNLFGPGVRIVAFFDGINKLLFWERNPLCYFFIGNFF